MGVCSAVVHRDFGETELPHHFHNFVHFAASEPSNPCCRGMEEKCKRSQKSREMESPVWCGGGSRCPGGCGLGATVDPFPRTTLSGGGSFLFSVQYEVELDEPPVHHHQHHTHHAGPNSQTTTCSSKLRGNGHGSVSLIADLQRRIRRRNARQSDYRGPAIFC